MNSADPSEVPERVPVAGTRKGPGARLMVLYGAMVLFLLALFGLNKPRNWLELTLHELREVFFFGFAALVILELTALIGRRWIRKRSLYYLVAITLTAGLVPVYEVLVPGDPEAPLRGLQSLVAAVGFLALSASMDRGLKREHSWLRGWPRRSIGLFATLLIVGVLHPLLPVFASYAGRAGAFPVVVDLASDWQAPLVEVEGAELFVGKGPDEWSRRAGRKVALLLFDGSPGGGVMVQEPYKDWTGFGALKLNIFSTASRPVRMLFRLEDSSRRLPPEERIDYPLHVVPGANDFVIPLEAFSVAPSGRELNLQKVRRVGLFLDEPAKPLRIYFHRMRLVEQ